MFLTILNSFSQSIRQTAAKGVWGVAVVTKVALGRWDFGGEPRGGGGGKLGGGQTRSSLPPDCLLFP